MYLLWQKITRLLPWLYGESFSTPELVISFSDSGLNGLSQNFHALIKNRVCRGVYRDKKCPVLLNLWEACYFDFTDETIKKAADSAADLGVELLVIDDGWFGKRDDDRSSLGDWYVNEDKIKCGLGEFCKYVNNKGLMLDMVLSRVMRKIVCKLCFE